jgi:hypothetical protein
MRFLKIFFLSLLALITLTAIAVYIVLTWYKNDVTLLLTDTLKKNYGINVVIGDVNISYFANWPQASVQLKDVTLCNDTVKREHAIVINAKSIGLSFNLRKLMDRQFSVRDISMRDADITITRNNLPPHPDEPRKRPDTTIHKRFEIDLRAVHFKRIKFRFLNPARGQKIAVDLVDNDLKVKLFEDGITGTLTGKTFFPGLVFNPRKGEFLKNCRAQLNFNVSFFRDEKTMMVKPGSWAVIDNQQYDLSCLLWLGENRRLALRAKGRQLRYERTAALLPARIRKKLENFVVKKPLDANILLVASLGKREEPVLLLHISGEHSDLEIGSSKIPYSDVTFHGRLISIDSSLTMGDNDHAVLMFYPLTGKLYSHPFQARITMRNLSDPFVTVTGKVVVNTAQLPIEPTDDLILNGYVNASVKYSAPADKINKREFLGPGTTLSASMSFKDVTYREASRNYVYRVNGTANLQHRNLTFKNVTLHSLPGTFTVAGSVDHFLDFALGEKRVFKGRFNAVTDILDLNPVLAKMASSKKDSAQVVRASSVPLPANQPSSPASTAAPQYEFNVTLRADSFKARQVTGTSAAMKMEYKRNLLRLTSFQMNLCEGKCSGSGTIRDLNKLDASVEMEDMNVEELFRQFENFGQTAIVSENLSGKISVDATFKSRLDEKMEVIGSTMSGDVNLHVKNGRLIHFEPLQNLASFLFRNRDFTDIRFSELNEAFSVNGYTLRIKELEIASSVLDLYVVGGILDFKGISTLNVLVPWHNLKKRERNYIPRNSGQSSENTKGLKISFQGPVKKMKISLGHKEIRDGRASM